MLPPIHFFAPHRRHYGGMMMFPMMNSWNSMMLKFAQPFIISNMISNLGTTIADIISGGRNKNCNCNHTLNNNFLMDGVSNYYGTYYPYVNLNNTQSQEGKGGTNTKSPDAISEMKSAYKEHGITTIYRGDDGRYFAITKSGEQLSALTLGDLADEIATYIKSNKTNKEEPVDKAKDDRIEKDEKKEEEKSEQKTTVVKNEQTSVVNKGKTGKSSNKTETKTTEVQTENKSVTSVKTGGRYKSSMNITTPDGKTETKYGYEYANGNKIYSSKSWDKTDSDAVFVIAGHRYNLELKDGTTLDYWDILGQRTFWQVETHKFIDPNTGKFMPNNPRYNGTVHLSADTEYNSTAPLNNAKIKKNKANQVVLVITNNGKEEEYLMDEVMAGKYNDKFK